VPAQVVQNALVELICLQSSSCPSENFCSMMKHDIFLMIPCSSTVSWQILVTRMSQHSVCLASETMQLLPVSPLDRYSDRFFFWHRIHTSRLMALGATQGAVSRTSSCKEICFLWTITIHHALSSLQNSMLIMSYYCICYLWCWILISPNLALTYN